MSDNTEYLEKLRHDFYGIIAGLLEIINPDLLDHSKKVAKGARLFAEILGWPQQVVQRVYVGGLVHDLGYLAAQNQDHQNWILLEDETPEQNNLHESHPVLGEKILRRALSFNEIRPIVRHHHEHYDGSGFPDGLSGRDIPAEARLMSIVDFFERVTVPRSDLTIMSIEEAEQILREDAGIIYDPMMIPIFLERVVPTGVLAPPAETD